MRDFLKMAAHAAIPLSVADIEQIPRFGRILPTMEGLEDIVVKQIRRNNGYKMAPIITGLISGDSDAHVLLDGYVGVAAAEKAGLTELPAIRLVLPDRLSALKVAIQLNCQQDMDDDLRFRIVRTLLEIFREHREYRPRYGMGRITDHIAATVGTSSRTVQRMIRILEAENAAELIELIGTGDLSVSAGEDRGDYKDEGEMKNPVLYL